MTAINGTGAPQGIDTVLNILGADELYANREELMGLFENKSFFNGGDDAASNIEAKIKFIDGKIKGLEEEAEGLLATIETKEKEIKEKADELGKTSANLVSTTGEFQSHVRVAAAKAAMYAVEAYRANNCTNKEEYMTYFEDNFENNLRGKMGLQGEIQKLFNDFKDQKNNLGDIAGEITDTIDDVKGINGRIQNINGTISVLKRTKSNMENSTIENAYQNVDTDGEIPIYSGKKADLANELIKTYGNIDIKGGTAKTEYTKEQQDKMDEWSSKNTEKYTKGDKYRSDQNPELANLKTAIQDGMIDELKNLGLGKEEIMTFIASKWNVGIKKTDDGNWSIPKGHGKSGSDDLKTTRAAYQTLVDMLTESTTANDVNSHQLKELQEAMSGKNGQKDILTRMYEKGFTFKEAMYTLTQIFPDAGITYDPKKQSPERNYSLVDDSKQSGTLYEDMATKILKYWNVGEGNGEKDDPKPTPDPERHDPFTFQMGDKTVTLIIDRDDDGKFSYTDGNTNDLVGSQNGIQELLNDKVDVNKDGILTAEELSNEGIMFMVNNQEESVANENDVDSYKDGSNYKGKGAYTNSVDFNVSYASGTPYLRSMV